MYNISVWETNFLRGVLKAKRTDNLSILYFISKFCFVLFVCLFVFCSLLSSTTVMINLPLMFQVLKYFTPQGFQSDTTQRRFIACGLAYLKQPSHVKLTLANLCRQTQNWCVWTTKQHVGKLSATNRTCLYSRQQFANMLLCRSHTPIWVCQHE